MRNILRFLLRHYFVMLFVLFELIGFILLINYNNFQNASIYKLRHAIIGRISEKYFDFSKYLSLREQNDLLIQENARLYNQLRTSKYTLKDESFEDSMLIPRFRFIPAKVINNSVNKQYNFITLDKGSIHGIKPDMGVIGPNGLVGIVKSVTRHFSSVVSILNIRGFSPSGKIKNSNFYGPIEWPGYNYQKVVLKDIPLHAKINIGDTVETSGISETFPEGIMIGTIEGYSKEKGVKYQLKIKLSTDFKKLTDVLIIENPMKDEQHALEESVKHD